MSTGRLAVLVLVAVMGVGVLAVTVSTGTLLGGETEVISVPRMHPPRSGDERGAAEVVVRGLDLARRRDVRGVCALLTGRSRGQARCDLPRPRLPPSLRATCRRIGVSAADEDEGQGKTVFVDCHAAGTLRFDAVQHGGRWLVDSVDGPFGYA